MLADRMRDVQAEQFWQGRFPKQRWSLPSRIGCAALCLLPGSVLPREGHSLVCVELGPGYANMPGFFNEHCGWGPQMDGGRRDRSRTILDFLRAVGPPERGIALFETHDTTTATPALVHRLWQLGIPVLAMSSPKGMAVRAGDALRHPTRQGVILIPDIEFISSAGYGQLRGTVMRGSAASPWEQKRSEVLWRGSSTGCVPGDTSPAGLAVNTRIRLALYAAQRRGSLRGGGAWNVGITSVVQVPYFVDRHLRAHGAVTNSMSIPEMLRARAIFDVDGNSNAWQGCFWKLLGNSVVLKVDGWHEQWYYSHLEPWKHYVPVARDLSDVEERVRHVLDSANDREVHEIADRATAVAQGLSYYGEVGRIRALLAEAFHPPPPGNATPSLHEEEFLATWDAAVAANGALAGAVAARIACTSERQPLLHGPPTNCNGH